MPHLNVGRWHHSSCTLDNTLYVFCGKVRNSIISGVPSEAINTVEKLSDANRTHINMKNRWQVLEFGHDFAARFDPAVSQLNAHEIVIFGGHIDDQYRTDVWIFDTRNC